jgi:hypothetical protein
MRRVDDEYVRRLELDDFAGQRLWGGVPLERHEPGAPARAGSRPAFGRGGAGSDTRPRKGRFRQPSGDQNARGVVAAKLAPDAEDDREAGSAQERR